MAAFNYKSLAWREARYEKLSRTNFTCEGCNRYCRNEPGRILVHHELGARRFPQHALDQRYLVTLCNTCHDAVHRVIRFPRLLEAADIGVHAQELVPAPIHWGPVPWQNTLDFGDAANDETFTLDPPIEVLAD